MKAMQDSDTVYSQGNPEPFYFAQNTYSDRLHYWDMSLLFKLGIHYNSPNGNWGIGFTLTTPNLHISGKGDVKKDYFRSNVFDNSTGQFTRDLAFSNYQIDVSTKIKDPFSIAFGLLYKIPNNNNSIMFTTEYFVAIDPYAMLKTTDSKVVGNTQIENVSEAMTFYSSANAVLNVGVGYDQFINDHFTIKSGFRTDFNTLTGQEQIILNEPWYNSRLSRIYYDKFHLIVGPAIRVKKFGVVLGIQYTWGRKSELSNTLSFVDPVEFDPLTHLSLQGVRQNNMKLSHNEISIFFGVTYGFAR
jgi:hypothetical protein